MALSQADLQVISTVFGKSTEELSGALSSENEVSLDLRLNGRVISQDQERELKENAVQQGKEIGYKDIAKSLEMDLEPGEKDPSVIAGKFKTKLSSFYEDKYKNMKPTEELEELRRKLEDADARYNKLNGTYEETLKSTDEWKNKFDGLQGEIKQKEINNVILKAFPEKMQMDRSDALLIARNSFEFEQTETGLIVKKDGKVITDPVGNPEKIENIIPLFAEEKKWIKSGGGMGGGDRGGNGLPKGMDYDKAIEYVKKAGVDVMSPKGSQMLKELTSK